MKLNLKAQDVIHAFWLPEFRIKQDMIPGQETSLIIKATREGTYPVVCAELCGPFHGGMRTQIIVHSPREYEEWEQSRIAAVAPEDLSEAVAAAESESYLEAATDIEVSPEHLAHLRHQVALSP